MDALEKARRLAYDAHNGQTDRYGQPYILHAERVMKMGRTRAEKITGILHDVVEKTDLTLEDLYREGFPENVISAVGALTRRDGEPYEDYISRLSVNPLAVAVKLNDLTDNMDLRRYPEIGDAEIGRLRKYHGAYLRLRSLPKNNRLTAARQRDPNAFKPWDAEQDRLLERLFSEGFPPSHISIHLGRSVFSIEMRILWLELPAKYDTGYVPSKQAMMHFLKQKQRRIK